MAMNRRINGGEGIITIIMVVLVLLITNGVNGKSTYGCWGGCYNECFLKTSGKTEYGGLACNYQCLNNCVPRSASDYMYYCEIGCSLKRCIPVSYDGAKLERCFGFCTNLCKKLISP